MLFLWIEIPNVVKVSTPFPKLIDPCPNCLVVLANKQYSVGRVYLKSLFSILYAPFCFFIFFMINKQQKK